MKSKSARCYILMILIIAIYAETTLLFTILNELSAKLDIYRVTYIESYKN